MVAESASNKGITEPAKIASEGISPCEGFQVAIKRYTKEWHQKAFTCRRSMQKSLKVHKIKSMDIVALRQFFCQYCSSEL